MESASASLSYSSYSVVKSALIVWLIDGLDREGELLLNIVSKCFTAFKGTRPLRDVNGLEAALL